MPKTIVFDVNETLLDLQVLRPHFERTFGNDRVLGEWFGLMLRLSLVATVTRTYYPFDVLGRDALRMTAEKHELSLDSTTVEAILGEMLSLPPHPDVIPTLNRFQQAGFRLATLTNSTLLVLNDQLAYAGLDRFFEQKISVEAVRLFKPAPETYHFAAAKLGVAINDIRLVAAHDWDVSGTIRAGAKAAFVARPGMVLGETAETPDIVGPDLLVIADLLGV